MKLFWEFADF